MSRNVAYQEKSSTPFLTKQTNKNYSALYKAIRAHSENPTQYSILMLVADFVNSSWGFFKEYKTISEEVKVSKRTIAKEIPRLIELGFLVVIQKATIHKAHVLKLGDIFLNEFCNANSSSRDAKSASHSDSEMQNLHVADAKSASLDMQNLHTNVLNVINKNKEEEHELRSPSSSTHNKLLEKGNAKPKTLSNIIPISIKIENMVQTWDNKRYRLNNNLLIDSKFSLEEIEEVIKYKSSVKHSPDRRFDSNIGESQGTFDFAIQLNLNRKNAPTHMED